MAFQAAAGAEWVAASKAFGEMPGKRRCSEDLSPSLGPVCVTGATGFIALHLVRQLLDKGYTVIGTVRSSDPRKLAPLLDFQREFGEDRLRIVEGVHCTEPSSFDSAVQGCVGVFHTASPVHFNTDDPERNLVTPAKAGTEGCLEACLKAGSVKRVVLTSSMATIYNHGKYPWDYTYSGKDWNGVCCPDSKGNFPEPVGPNAYTFGKLLAENAAWDFVAASKCPFDMATIHPPWVVGKNVNRPSSREELNLSSEVILKILLGEQAPQPNSLGWVDVEDVARAHIEVYERAEAGGRRFVCAVDDTPTWTELAEMLKELRPDCHVVCDPPAEGPGVRLGHDTSPLKSLSGFTFRPLRETLRMQCDSLADLGLIPKC